MTEIAAVASTYTPPPVSAPVQAAPEVVASPVAEAVAATSRTQSANEPPAETYTAIADASSSTVRGVALDISA